MGALLWSFAFSPRCAARRSARMGSLMPKLLRILSFSVVVVFQFFILSRRGGDSFLCPQRRQ